MSLDIGRTLGHYTIVGRLGRGGMGEVYAAQDAKLNRRVALKILPPEMAANAERLERFRREAQAVAALNHPNIVTIYAVEHIDDVHFITLELVEGRTLDELITAGGMALEQFFEVAIPLVDAVAAAHERGIVHRDLKPSNVMVTAEDRVKVLDFGLAKLLETGPVGDASTALADEHLTEEGKVMGTVAYMSPEQAEGKPLDHRTDVFSLGILLYEMATGTRPFKGDTRLSVMSSIVKDTPASITELNTQVPRHLGRIVKKALEKNITKRYQSTLELRNDLEELKEEIDSGQLEATATSISDPEALRPVVTPSSRRSWQLVVGIGAAVLLAIVAWQQGWLGGRTNDALPLQELTQLTREAATDYSPSIYANGTMVAFARVEDGQSDIFLQGIGGGTPVRLTDEGRFGGPAVSPDESQVAFHASDDPGGIYVMPLPSGQIKQLTDFGYDPAWSPDGSAIVFAEEGIFGGSPYGRGSAGRLTLGRVDLATGRVTDTDIGDAMQPAWSPNGHRIAFWGIRVEGEVWRDIYTAPADGGEPVPVTTDPYHDFSPAWSPDGRWLYFCSTRGGSMAIWRVRIDEVSGMTMGDPQPVSTGGPTTPGGLRFSADGARLVYWDWAASSVIDVADFDPDRLRVTSDWRPVWQGPLSLQWMAVSPDGRWLAFRSMVPQSDIFVVGTDGETAYQVTDDLANDIKPMWSPDSARLSFYSGAEKGNQAWVVNLDGGGRMRVSDVESDSARVLETHWSPDGQHIMFYAAGSEGGTFLARSDVPYDQQDPPALIVSRERDERFGLFDSGNPVYFRPLNWHHGSNRVVGLSGVVLLPETGAFELSAIGMPPEILNIGWMADGRRIYYETGGVFYVRDTVTGQEWATDVPTEGSLGISADSRLIYRETTTASSNLWMREFK